MQLFGLSKKACMKKVGAELSMAKGSDTCKYPESGLLLSV
jgi:hypothetical protein